jgi:hypothetical protein
MVRQTQTREVGRGARPHAVGRVGPVPHAQRQELPATDPQQPRQPEEAHPPRRRVAGRGQDAHRPVIKYITQSSWSHSTIYVGDRAVREGQPKRDHYLERFGDEARFLVAEADMADGVHAVPLAKYTEYNIRVCRPYCIGESDLERVLDEIVSHIGDQYDRRQLLDLGRYLTPFHLLPARWRRRAFFSGESGSRAVICSSLIAQAFHGVRYPILPLLPASVQMGEGGGPVPLGQAHAPRAPAAGAAARLRPVALFPDREVQLGRGGTVRLRAHRVAGELGYRPFLKRPAPSAKPTPTMRSWMSDPAAVPPPADPLRPVPSKGTLSRISTEGTSIPASSAHQAHASPSTIGGRR